jgi:dihydrofolate reductase
MKVIMAMVMSLDGKTTKWHRPKIYEWTSPEDREYFSFLLKKQKVLILGRKTYEAAKTFITSASPSLKIVLTDDPKKYRLAEKPGRLEFVKDKPRRLIDRLRSKGFKTAMLIGGELTNTAFLKMGLIDEIWITIEPLLLGSGNGLFLKNNFSIPLVLYDYKKINQRGTLLLKYRVQKISYE